MSSEKSSQSEQIVMLPVPISVYPVVVQALNRALAGSSAQGPEGAPSAPEVISPVQAGPIEAVTHSVSSADLGPEHPFGFIKGKRKFPEVPWTQAEILELRSIVLNRPAIVALFDLCASEPGRWFNLSDVAARAKVDYAIAKGGTSALTRSIHAHFKRDNWPTAWQWHKTELRAYYAMDAKTADMWLRARTKT